MRRHGFTLLEILVAMVIASMLVLLTGHVFGSAMRGRERLRENAVGISAERRAYELMSRDMHSAIVPPDDSGLQFGLTTTGAGAGTNVLQFAAVVSEPLLAGRAANETALVQYSIAEDPRTGQPTLWRYETPYPIPEGTDPSQNQEARALPLLPGVVSASYLFYSTTDQNWIESWEGASGLPTAIRVDLVFGNSLDQQGNPARQESWIFSLPAAKFANDEANAAAEAEAAGTGTGTTPGTGAAGGGATR